MHGKIIAFCFVLLFIILLLRTDEYEHMDTVSSGSRIVVTDTSGNLNAISFPTLYTELDKDLNNYMRYVPRGVIVMWSGTLNDIPRGWKLCDGKGTTPANDGVVAQGIVIPDLRGRFIIGVNPADNRTMLKDNQIVPVQLSLYEMNSMGGEEKHTLTVDEMSHVHDTKIYETWRVAGGNGQNVGHEKAGSGKLTSEGPRIVTPPIGHNNLPPYYTLAYIIKVV